MTTKKTDNKPLQCAIEIPLCNLVQYDVLQGRFLGDSYTESSFPTMLLSPKLDAIQKLIIVRHREYFDESPSPMKLQKLCYYAQGYLLAQGTELFPEDFQAWQHGPVVPALYQRYKKFAWRNITDDIELDPAEGSNDVEREVSDIVAAYGRYDGAALSTMTHREAPWCEARGELPEDEGSTAVITKASLRTYFAGKLADDGSE